MIASRKSRSTCAAVVSPVSIFNVSRFMLFATVISLTFVFNHHTVPYNLTTAQAWHSIRRAGWRSRAVKPGWLMTIQSNFISPDSSDPRLQSKSRYRMLVDGKSVDAASGKTIDRVSPGHAGMVVGTWPDASADDVRAAIAAARRAFDTGPWPRMSGAERSRLMFKTAELILAHVEEIALIESLEVGKPIAQARGEITFCADLWSYAAGQARALEGQTHNNIGDNRLGLVLREPVGVVGIITPWNFPFIIASERVPWAIGGGCTVVLKPSEFTSGTSIRMAELAREAGIPDGVFNVVTGYGDPAGQILAEDPGTDMIAFTGSVRVGTKLGEIAARSVKRVGLELGGKGPQIVFADADLEAAADGIAYGVYHNAGQCCISGSRLLVQEGIRDALIDRLLDISRKVTFGDPLNERTKIGAMISEAHAAKVHSYVEAGQAEGAELLLGGAAGRAGRWALLRADRVFRCHRRHVDRPRGDLRTGSVDADVQDGR